MATFRKPYAESDQQNEPNDHFPHMILWKVYTFRKPYAESEQQISLMATFRVCYSNINRKWHQTNLPL